MQKGLFIGGTHVDILADAKMEYMEDAGIDLPGQFTIAVGGTMFNVCANMNYLGVNCTLVSACKKNSLFTYVVEHVLRNIKINYKLIYPDNAKESAFLALREKGDLLFAVTASAWDDIQDKEIAAYLETLVKGNYDFVVLDGNIPSKYTKLFIECFYNIPIYFCATSSIKLNRFLMLNNSEKRIDAMFMNKMEYDIAMNIFKDFKKEYTTYFVTKAEDGVDVYQHGKCIHFSVPSIEEGSFSGAGDAFAAGVIYGLQNQYKLEEAVQKGFSMVKEKLKYQHSNIVPIEVGKIKQEIMQDKLTGVYSRNIFEEEKHLLGEFSYVLLIDIDNFKQVNDTYGHDYGDIVLKSVASVIKADIRKNDKLYRYGGEEFILFLSNVNEQITKEIAERIRKKVFENCDVTITIGVASINHNIDESIKKADKALYIGKATGKNKVVFEYEVGFRN